VLSSFKKRLDEWAIRAACATVRCHGARNDPAEIDRMLRSPDFLRLTENPAELKFRTVRDFTFDSPCPGRWRENNMVHGKLHTVEEHWREKPMIILIHGWNGEFCYDFIFPYLAWRLRRRGINVAMLELPYHRQRKPSAAGAIRNFISDDMASLLGATQQSIGDIRALQMWAVGQGCPSVGLWGFSLGAWLAGLFACLPSRICVAVLTTPVCQMDRVIQNLAFCEPIRQALQDTPISLEAFDLTRRKPTIPQDRLLIVKSEYDLFAAPDTLEDLWRAWDEPEIWRVQHAHLSVLISPFIVDKTVQWIASRLCEAPRLGESVP